MTALVSLKQVKAGLNIDTNEKDTLLALYIGAASEMVISHLKEQAAELIDLEAAAGNSPAGADAPDAVKLSVIFLVGVMVGNPDSDTEKLFENGQLPAPVRAMLYPLRDPAIA